jgi:peptidoglycan/xylan/chitin deacetylase (PgdA/CDA1 family)
VGPPSEEGWDSWYYVSTESFEAQLDFMIAEGWAPIDHGDLLRGLEQPDLLSDRSALVTFDDGYKALEDHAFPALEKAGFPAVVFVPTAYIGGANLFDDGQEPPEQICSWPDIQAWTKRDVSIQSHGVGHLNMSDLDRDARMRELVGSKEQLESGLQEPVELFAFPFGDEGEDPRIMTDMVKRAGYRAAFLYGGSPFDPAHADRFRLPRLAVGADTDLAQLLD